MFLRAGLFVLTLSGPLFSQTPTPLAFEVAEIRINQSGLPGMSAQFLPGGQLRVTNAPMRMLLTLAYHVQPQALLGEPGWVHDDRFDIIAKGKPGSSEDDLRLMLRTLLTEHFKLAAHREEKIMPAYALVVGKGGPKLKPSTPAKPSESRCHNVDGPPEQFHFLCEHMTVPELAEALPGMAPRYITMAVVDRTAIKGTYEFPLDWTPTSAPGAGRGGDAAEPTIETTGGFTIFDAISKLGLKLEKARLPVPVIVIDHLERTLRPN
jgi:uncharacterized protein (TIGR03435 family)